MGGIPIQITPLNTLGNNPYYTKVLSIKKILPKRGNKKILNDTYRRIDYKNKI